MKCLYPIIKNFLDVFVICVIVASLCSCAIDDNIESTESNTELNGNSVENISDNVMNTTTIDEEIKVVDYEANMDIIKGISRVVVENIRNDNDYLVNEDEYYYPRDYIIDEMASEPLSVFIKSIYYADSDANEVLNVDDVLSVINDSFEKEFNKEDVSDSFQTYYVKDNQIIRNDSEWYSTCIGAWNNEEKKYYIECYHNSTLFSKENETCIVGSYHKLNKRAVIEFSEANNELGFEICGVTIFDYINDSKWNPWYLYDIYNDETKFVNINEVNWDEFEYGFFTGDYNIVEEFLPVLEQTSTVRMFSNLNCSQSEEVYIDNIKVGAISIYDLDKNGFNEMIMSVYKGNEWRMMIISHIDDKYYGYIYEKYGCLALTQNGLYYSTDDNEYGKDFDICVLHISENGFSEDCVLTFHNAGEILFGDINFTLDEYMTWTYENMDAMVPFWSVE